MKQLSSNGLKWIALVTMVLDHIWRFFPKAPYAFHILSRISAPLFLFCLAVGLHYTKDFKKYFLRLYLLNLVMIGVNFFIIKNEDMHFNVIPSFLLISILVAIWEQKESRKRNLFLGVFFIYQILIAAIQVFLVFSHSGVSDSFLYLLVDGGISLINMSGGLYYILLGLIFYFQWKDYKKLTFYTLLLSLCAFGCFNTGFLARGLRVLHLSDLSELIMVNLSSTLLDFHPFRSSREVSVELRWLCGAVVLFLPFYSGQKGKWFEKSRPLFYLLYPLHLVLLRILCHI